MLKATEYNLRRTAKRKAILGHQNNSNKELDKLKKIDRMNNLSLNALEQMATARH